MSTDVVAVVCPVSAFILGIHGSYFPFSLPNPELVFRREEQLSSFLHVVACMWNQKPEVLSIKYLALGLFFGFRRRVI